MQSIQNLIKGLLIQADKVTEQESKKTLPKVSKLDASKMEQFQKLKKIAYMYCIQKCIRDDFLECGQYKQVPTKDTLVYICETLYPIISKRYRIKDVKTAFLDIREFKNRTGNYSPINVNDVRLYCRKIPKNEFYVRHHHDKEMMEAPVVLDYLSFCANVKHPQNKMLPHQSKQLQRA